MQSIKYLFVSIFLLYLPSLYGQSYFNAWLTTCSHLIGPTGNPNSLKLAIDQSRGLLDDVPGFEWDIMIDVGDWTASQTPPGNEEGKALAQCLNATLGKDRGRFFTVSGNHDGDAKGWEPGEFTRKFVNPLGNPQFLETSGFTINQRPNQADYRQLIEYPGTRWDRYLIRTGNVIWIMLGDRNEFDGLAELRGDTSGSYQAGRGSAAGMPDGGYPSGAVTLDTFEWWKKVIEDPNFSNDILITTHHLMPMNTTITTDNGEPGDYHGASGSIGPKGEIGGQLYWIREYNDRGKEIHQYAQTRPFLNYLKDHPGAIAAWVGGHTHINNPESMINGRGMYVRRYDVTFISVGALTDSHGGGNNQMTRMLTFKDGREEAIINVYIHKSNNGYSIGWYEPAARKILLGKKFKCPKLSTNNLISIGKDQIASVPNVRVEALRPRYRWNFNHDKSYDFNNNIYVVGEDGSPYGVYEGDNEIVYSEDIPSGKGRSLNLEDTRGQINFCSPYTPEMNWSNITMSLWCKLQTKEPRDIVSYITKEGKEKFKFWFDGEYWIWEVGSGVEIKAMKWKSQESVHETEWHHFVAIANGDRNLIELYVDGNLIGETEWNMTKLCDVKDGYLILGYSIDKKKGSHLNNLREISLIDEVEFYDRVITPKDLNK